MQQSTFKQRNSIESNEGKRESKENIKDVIAPVGLLNEFDKVSGLRKQQRPSNTVMEPQILKEP